MTSRLNPRTRRQLGALERRKSDVVKLTANAVGLKLDVRDSKLRTAQYDVQQLEAKLRAIGAIPGAA